MLGVALSIEGPLIIASFMKHLRQAYSLFHKIDNLWNKSANLPPPKLIYNFSLTPSKSGHHLYYCWTGTYNRQFKLNITITLYHFYAVHITEPTIWIPPEIFEQANLLRVSLLIGCRGTLQLADSNGCFRFIWSIMHWNSVFAESTKTGSSLLKQRILTKLETVSLWAECNELLYQNIRFSSL